MKPKPPQRVKPLRPYEEIYNAIIVPLYAQRDPSKAGYQPANDPQAMRDIVERVVQMHKG